MANRVVVTICGEEYTFVAEESPSYMQKVGAYVGDKMDVSLRETGLGGVAGTPFGTKIAEQMNIEL